MERNIQPKPMQKEDNDLSESEPLIKSQSIKPKWFSKNFLDFLTPDNKFGIILILAYRIFLSVFFC